MHALVDLIKRRAQIKSVFNAEIKKTPKAGRNTVKHRQETSQSKGGSQGKSPKRTETLRRGHQSKGESQEKGPERAIPGGNPQAMVAFTGLNKSTSPASQCTPSDGLAPSCL